LDLTDAVESMLAEGNAPACQCNGGQPKNFLQPCLLLLLFQRPSHGYDLLDRLAQAGLSIGAPDPAAVYRTLRQMERDGLVISRWDPSSHGPPRRTYELSSEGEDLLHTWAQSIRQNRKVLDRYLTLYSSKIDQDAPDEHVRGEEFPTNQSRDARGKQA
jgi:PadR family transcriptional regulator, regulatory protein PadR